jgi:hypothetical protein
MDSLVSETRPSVRAWFDTHIRLSANRRITKPCTPSTRLAVFEHGGLTRACRVMAAAMPRISKILRHRRLYLLQRPQPTAFSYNLR